jgi:hypothetical protein
MVTLELSDDACAAIPREADMTRPTPAGVIVAKLRTAIRVDQIAHAAA